MPEMGMAGMTVCTGMAGPRPGEPGVPWWERWRAVADFTGVATAAAWDLAPEPVLARGAPDGDVVITEARITCTLPHGGHYENDYCCTFEFFGGLLHRIREYMDTRHGTAQFAVVQRRA